MVATLARRLLGRLRESGGEYHTATDPDAAPQARALLERADALAAAWPLADATEYLAASEVATLLAPHRDLLDRAALVAASRHLTADERARMARWIERVDGLPEEIAARNRAFVARRITEETDPFDRLEAFPLTARQREAIVTNEDTTLVVAGAGTGKTSTIVGRVDYLLRRGLATPEQILVLAYNRAAAEEVRGRLATTGVAPGVTVSTFHAIGLAIVGQATGRRPFLPPVAEDAETRKRFMRHVLRGMLADPAHRALLVAFLADHLDEAVEGGGEERSGHERLLAERSRGLRAIDGTRLRSREEVMIGNWLTLNGIAWWYESEYPHHAATPWRSAYRPDFHLPGHRLYLEHFGVDRQGRPAPWVNAPRYREAMDWKRAIHRQHGTTLLETYSWMRREGTLIRDLERMLRQHGVVPRPLTEAEIGGIVDEENFACSAFVGLLDQFRSLHQGTGDPWASLVARARTDRDRAFLALFEVVLGRYQEEVARVGGIDFDGMINRARQHLRDGEFASPWTHIVVDEFQDISANRLGLLLDLRDRQPGCRLFAVGDDWQAIYRFAGSDVGVMTGLGDRVGALARVDLDTVFRYPQELLDLSAAFVMRNPAQLRKTLVAQQGASGERPVTLFLSEPDEEDGPPSTVPTQIADDIARRADGRAATVAILGRYHAALARPEVEELVRLLRERDLRVDRSTIHAAKGLQADFAVVVGVRAGEWSFPSAIEDDPLLRMVLSPTEAYPHAEERRLFYVALTRARGHAYLTAPADAASAFLRDDLLAGALRDFVDLRGDPRRSLVCPRCGGPTIRPRRWASGTVTYRCANFRACWGQLAPCPDCGNGALALGATPGGDRCWVCSRCGTSHAACPKCGEGRLVRVKGQFGPFLACSNGRKGWGCDYKRDVPLLGGGSPVCTPVDPR